MRIVVGSEPGKYQCDFFRVTGRARPADDRLGASYRSTSSRPRCPAVGVTAAVGDKHYLAGQYPSERCDECFGDTRLSDTWVNGGTPAYILSDAGYDVWMGNARGNTYSRRHASLKPTSSAFWKFSWHEIGYYDLPAMIDYVLKETKVPKIQYIGFSQGTTVFWVLMSTRSEYNEKVAAMQALAPVAYIGNIKSPLIKAIAPFTNSLETMLPVVMGHTPAGASTRQLIHFGQLYKSDKFVQFDHGWLTNKRIYGTFKPPAYNLGVIKTPVFLHYADNDWLSTPKDVKKLAAKIPSVVGTFRVPLGKFNHLDFVFAINATELIYSRVLNIMSQFKNQTSN
ncbi:unnamed protein product [Spodoptera exigua]|nr:unnamed protein product [Spodoptera exigua]